MKRTAIIIGAGPAGLTAAYELIQRSDIQPIVLEKGTHMGGIARTVNFKGNRIDIGPHRFFSKSDRVMNWWREQLPVESPQEAGERGRSQRPEAKLRMMSLKRKTRIYFLRKFFDYPVKLSPDTLSKLGWLRTIRIGASYASAVCFPPKKTHNLEQFFISRFGRELYHTFFKDYTEKVWGVACRDISSDWGAQRIKGLSISKSIAHFARQLISRNGHNGSGGDISQKKTETSLIEQFLYPRRGTGQMWETVAEKVIAGGGQILTGFDVRGLKCEANRITAVTGLEETGAEKEVRGDYFFSTMPIKELVASLQTEVPPEVKTISQGLMYRDHIIVGLVVNKLKVREPNGKTIEDNWIYIQEPDVTAGRMQIFNNWGPDMVADPNTIVLGVEYFCFENDKHWRRSDAEMAELCRQELAKIGILDAADVLDSIVMRIPKTYPAYFGTYPRFQELRRYLDTFENLYLVGRNGMHKYNNQDHSMLTAMTAVDNLLAGCKDKENIWEINTEEEYHEVKKEISQSPSVPQASGQPRHKTATAGAD